jgi:hypothetical protein
MAASPVALYSRMSGKLGVPRNRSDEDLASLVERRLPASSIKALVRGGMSDAEIYQLIVLLNPLRRIPRIVRSAGACLRANPPGLRC